MRILFITHGLGFGGAEKMLTFVANRLSSRGHVCAIADMQLTPDYTNAKKQVPDPSIEIFPLERAQGNKNRHYVRELCRVSRQFNPDVLVSFITYPNLCCAAAGKCLGLPTVISERGDPSVGGGRSFKQRLWFYMINRSRGGVFQTQGAQDLYQRGLRKRGVVIPNPIFVEGELPRVSMEQREKTVVSVGRLENRQKRLDIMLEAFRIFQQTHPEYILKIYGSGSQEQELRDWCRDMGLEEKVRFMGVTKQPMQTIAADGMFLITSDFEGISNSLLEAMAAGLPCVSTDHTPGGARLLIQDGENGLLAPIGDAPALAAAMCRFAEDPALAAKCGENARLVTERFAPQRIIDLWEQYLQKISGKV